MYLLITGIKSDLHAVERCLFQFPAIILRQLDSVRVKPCHKPFGIIDQLCQILPHGGFSAGKGDLGNSGFPALVNDPLPLSRI